MGRATATLFFLAAAGTDYVLCSKILLGTVRYFPASSTFEFTEGAAAASSNTTNPLKCYTGALGAKFESTCDADVKHCIIHIMSKPESLLI